MQFEQFRAKSKQLRTEVNFHWSALSAEDLQGFDGQRDNLIDLLETRYGFARQRAEREVDWFLDQFEDRLRKAS
jgi:hypothetical protein